MVELNCPWCEEQALLAYLELTASDASFTCTDCGTSVELVEEPAELDLAA